MAIINNSQQNNGKRQASIELLRSVAMLMVISMHYLDKGNVTIPLDQPQTIMSILGWMLHSFCIVAVNCYVLISGYFLVESEFKWKKLVNLILQVLFYSILVPVVMVALEILNSSEIDLYKILLYVLPVQTKHYWFATSYILLYIFSPVLAAGVKNMTQKNMKITIGIALLVLSVSKTILPFQLDLDEYGYNFIWFVVLFLVAAYIRLYGIKCIQTSEKSFAIYVIGSLLTCGLAFVIRAASLYFGKFGYFVTRTFDYNHILCFISSVALFLCFLYMNLNDTKLGKLAVVIGPYTFGVYLLHEQWEMRHVWPTLLKTEQFAGRPIGILHWIVSIFVVFTIGIIVDFGRSKLFVLINKILCRGKSKA